MDKTETLLKPGQQIKPYVPNEVIHQLVKKLYNLEVLSMKELNSYDDKNFHIQVFLFLKIYVCFPKLVNPIYFRLKIMLTCLILMMPAQMDMC